jgi:hypothetical protein
VVASYLFAPSYLRRGSYVPAVLCQPLQSSEVWERAGDRGRAARHLQPAVDVLQVDAQVALIARMSRITFCAAAPTACGLGLRWLFAVKVAQKTLKSAVSRRNSRDSGGVFGMGTAEDRGVAPVAGSRDIWPSFPSAAAMLHRWLQTHGS